MTPAALFLSVFFPLFALYLRTLSPTIPLEDGGEMIRAAWCLGVTHPPGYPLYSLLGRLFLEVPLGDPAFRVNLLSALAGASACGVLALAVAGVYRGFSGAREAALAGIFSGLMLGTGYSAWWQSVIAEKYSLNLLLASLTMLALLRALRGGALGPLAFSFGVWLGHHGMAVYFLPGILLAVFLRFKESGFAGLPAGLSRLALLFLLGLSPKLGYTPLRAAAHPLHNWNDPEVWWRFREYLTAEMYAWRIFYQTGAAAVSRLASHAINFIPHQFGWAGAALGLAGAGSLIKRSRIEALALGLSALAGTVFCMFFRLEGVDVETYYMPVFLVMALFIGTGSGYLLARFTRRPAYLAVVFSALVVFNGWLHRAAGRDRHYFAYDATRNILDSVPADCLLLSHGDFVMFPLWYTHDILGFSPGATLVDAVYMAPGMCRPEIERRVQLYFPDGQKELAARFPFADMLFAGEPGRPVYLAVIFMGLERTIFYPRGSAYRVARGWDELKRADVLAEYGVYRRRMRYRGIYSDSLIKDQATEELLGKYEVSLYWRGYGLMFQGKYRDAEAMLNAALSWPAYSGVDRAALYGSLAWCLEKRGENAGAVAGYAEAVRLEPRRPALLKPYAALLARTGRKAEALEVYRQAAAANPSDREAREKIMGLMLSGENR